MPMRLTDRDGGRLANDGLRRGQSFVEGSVAVGRCRRVAGPGSHPFAGSVADWLIDRHGTHVETRRTPTEGTVDRLI